MLLIVQISSVNATRLVANYLHRMRSTFFDIAGCVSCFGRRRWSHQNMSAKRWESTLGSKLDGASVSCKVLRACVLHPDINEASLFEVSDRIRWGDEIGSASIF